MGKRKKDQSTQVYYFAITVSMKDIYNTELDADITQHDLEDFFKDHCKNWIYQLEKGLIGARLHFQCFVHLEKKDRQEHVIKNLLERFDIKCFIDVKPASLAGVEALKKYCMKKDDTFVKGPWMKNPPYELDPLQGWQLKLHQYLLKTPDKREIIWIYDQVGNTGKTHFARFMEQYHGAFYLTLVKVTDIFNLVVKQGPRTIYIFDLTRAKPQDICNTELYIALETIKNGCVNSGKYEGGILRMRPPHVVALANHQPDLTQCSQDRWNVKTLTVQHRAEIVQHAEIPQRFDF